MLKVNICLRLQVISFSIISVCLKETCTILTLGKRVVNSCMKKWVILISHNLNLEPCVHFVYILALISNVTNVIMINQWKLSVLGVALS